MRVSSHTTRRWALAMLAGLGCVIGFRGQAEFEGEHDLQGIEEVRLALPSSPVRVIGCAPDVPATCPERLEYAGVWLSTGGTRDDARDNARQPAMVFETLQRFAELRAEVPLEVEGLVELQMEDVRLPGDRDLEVRTSVGDIEVLGVQAHVVVDVQTGDILVRGGEAGVGVRTELGTVQIESAGDITASVGGGDVVIRQTGAAAELVIEVDVGDIDVQLASAANLDLRIEASGDIRIQTDEIVQVSSGSLVRETGTASIDVVLVTRRGNVEVTDRS